MKENEMPKSETVTNGVMINGQYIDIPELLRLHDQAVKAQAATIVSHGRIIADLRTEIEQLQEAAIDAPSLIGSTADQPFVERYARVNITKGANGDYRHETTVSVTMTGGTWLDVEHELEWGLRAADDAARYEIEQRIGADQHPHESDDPNEPAF